MAQKFLTNIDLNQNQLINATFEVLGADPSSGNFEGRLIYNSTTDTIKVYANGAWRSLPHTIASGGGAGIAEALTVSESNGTVTLTLNVADVDSAGLLSSTFWGLLNGATSEATISTLAKRDSSGNIKVATPTDAAHAATKGYVDSARQGLDVKQSVRAATTGPVTIASDLEAGDTLDTTVTLVAGNRVLVKNQSTASENGIYVVQASGAAVRATDANGTADTGEVSGGTFVFVEEGTLNADSGFVVSSNGPITVGTDAMNWVQFSGAGAITAGDGLTQTGTTINAVGTTDRISVSANAIDIDTGYLGQASITTLGTITTGVWTGTDVAVADGGTGASTAADARTNLGIKTSAGAVTTSTSTLARVAKQGCAASATGVSTTVVTHNFNTTDVNVQIYEVSTGATVIGDVTRSNADALSVVLYGTISANDYTIVVVG
jgi:hypothetical protein